MNFENIHPNQFHYDLPEERIAQYPLADRSASKLLHYANGTISHRKFIESPELIDPNSLLIFNDTRVIPARLFFFKKTGAKIEVFLLDPLKPGKAMEEVMKSTDMCIWKCMIGNAKKWSKDIALELDLGNVVLTAKRINDQEVEFKWNGGQTFSEILDLAGKLPLPPYIHRDSTELDKDQYQTVYSRVKGAVAAPTAGLHFTEKIITEIRKSSTIDQVTLHVSAGTFQPIKSSVAQHSMHREQIIITRSNLENLLDANHVICVGTTSMRTIESLYWYGVRLNRGDKEFFVEKLDPHELDAVLTPKESIREILSYMNDLHTDSLIGHTEIFIFPGYQFKYVNGLFTNFHLPGTTLMMLVAAFVGDDWKRIYQEALKNDYRFLSYGDSSLLFR